MLVVGYGGLALQLIDDLEDQYKDHLVFWADKGTSQSIITRNYKVISTTEEITENLSHDKRFILAIGNPLNRQILAKKFLDYGGECISFISKKANISRYSQIGQGSVILQNVVIEAEVQIKSFCLINTAAIITHECTIGNFCELAPSVLVLGQVTINDLTFVGANTTILPKLNIGFNVTIGAKSLVTHNMPDNLKVFGIPAKP